MVQDDILYFDNNATTRPLPEVVEAMLPYLQDQYANPSSLHRLGQQCRHAVEEARAQVAELIGAAPREIVFTSCGTESINLAIRGALARHPQRRCIVTTAVEHSATLRAVERLAEEGYEIRSLGVNRDGQLDFEAVDAALTQDVALLSFMHANNETGVLFDTPRIAEFAARCKTPVHVDAVQTAGKIPLCVKDWPADFVSLSGHKFHGPKGVGALYVRKRSNLTAQILGGSQERMLRGGTENVPGIIGLGAACRIVKGDLAAMAQRIGALRDRFEREICQCFPSVQINGAAGPRVCNTSNVSFYGLAAEAVLILLSEAGLCASSGAACSSGSLEPSHVLQAMGVEEKFAHGAIRFSFSRWNTRDEIDRAVRCIPTILAPLASLNAPRNAL